MDYSMNDEWGSSSPISAFYVQQLCTLYILFRTCSESCSSIISRIACNTFWVTPNAQLSVWGRPEQGRPWLVIFLWFTVGCIRCATLNSPFPPHAVIGFPHVLLQQLRHSQHMLVTNILLWRQDIFHKLRGRYWRISKNFSTIIITVGW